MIHQSYAALVKSDPARWEQEGQKWDDFDKSAYANPKIRACTFVTCLDGEPIGLGSYDPRPGPEYGIVGQNCILPEYQGRGYGTQQIAEILRIFRQKKFKKARVTTSEHPFFLPAQKMYQKLGFKEIGRKPGGPDPNYKIIEFELVL